MTRDGLLVVAFDIDDTLLPGVCGEAQKMHCRRLGQLWLALVDSHMAELHIISGRTEDQREQTNRDLEPLLIWLWPDRLHLKADSGMTDAEHKLAIAREIGADILIDNSDTCLPVLTEAGFTYLKVPEANGECPKSVSS